MTHNPFNREKSGLVKEIKWYDVTFMSIAAPAASGILYYSVNMQANFPGGNLSLAFALGMLAFLPIVILLSMLASTMPRAGSLYVVVSRIVSPHLGYLGAALYIIGQALVAGILGNIIMNILGGILITAGTIYKMGAILEMGNTFSSKMGNLIGGIIWVLFFWFISLKGMKVFNKFMRIFFWIPLISCCIIILYVTILPSSSVVEIFNGYWGAGSYQNIINSANQNGMPGMSFSFSQTLGLFLIVIWSYNGIEMAAYAGSEIQSPGKSIIKGFFWGWLGVGLLYIVLSFIIPYKLGGLIPALDYLSEHNLLQGNLAGISPSVPFYFMSISKSPLFGLIISLFIVLWFANSIPPDFLATSRITFSLAMDRSIPSSLAKVKQPFAVPTNAIHLVALIAIAGVVLQTYNVNVVISTTMFCAFFIFWLYGFAGIILPYKMPHLLEDSPLNIYIGRIHLMSILGCFTFFFGWFFIFITLRDIVNNYVIMLILASLMLLIIAIYLYQNNKNKDEHINIDDIYSQLPPE